MAAGSLARSRSPAHRPIEAVCFYQMHARELAQANGWRTLMTSSAKLVNIVAGYGYEPVLAPVARCVESAVAGRILT